MRGCCVCAFVCNVCFLFVMYCVVLYVVLWCVFCVCVLKLFLRVCELMRRFDVLSLCVCVLFVVV